MDFISIQPYVFLDSIVDYKGAANLSYQWLKNVARFTSLSKVGSSNKNYTGDFIIIIIIFITAMIFSAVPPVHP